MLQDNINQITAAIQAELKNKEYVLVAIDGRCASGKTTLAQEIQKTLLCNVIHIDDFFLRPEQRTQKRLETPGENVDHERFLSEVLLPLKANKTFSYRPFDCHTQTLLKQVEVKPDKITIIEGSYSCHPNLWDYYDIHIFMDIDGKTQLKRISARNGENGVKVFREKWIPLEEKYFETFKVKEKCELIIGSRNA